MNPRYELRFEADIEVEKAVWHRHGHHGDHFHTAAAYRMHSPVRDEEIIDPPEERDGLR